MSRVIARTLLCAGFLGAAIVAFAQSTETDVRFAALDVYVISAEPLAAWQFELRETSGRMRVVGVENGESAAFGEAPYYDLAVVSEGAADRVIVADYSMRPAGELPSGRSRVATIHVQLEGAAGPSLRAEPHGRGRHRRTASPGKH